MSFVWMLDSLPALASPLIGKFIDRHGHTIGFRLGFIMNAVSLACITFVHGDSRFELILFVSMITLISIGTMFVVIPSMVCNFKSLETFLSAIQVLVSLTPVQTDVSTTIEWATQTEQEGQKPDPGTAVSQSSTLLNLAMTVPGIIGLLWANISMKTKGWPALSLSLALLNMLALIAIPSRRTDRT